MQSHIRLCEFYAKRNKPMATVLHVHRVIVRLYEYYSYYCLAFMNHEFVHWVYAFPLVLGPFLFRVDKNLCDIHLITYTVVITFYARPSCTSEQFTNTRTLTNDVYSLVRMYTQQSKAEYRYIYCVQSLNYVLSNCSVVLHTVKGCCCCCDLMKKDE